MSALVCDPGRMSAKLRPFSSQYTVYSIGLFMISTASCFGIDGSPEVLSNETMTPFTAIFTPLIFGRNVEPYFMGIIVLCVRNPSFYATQNVGEPRYTIMEWSRSPGL